MAKAADRAAWFRTFAVLAQLFNANRDPKNSDPIDPMQFYPWHEKAERQGLNPPTEIERQQLRKLYPKKDK